jgi:pectinesterase
VEEGNRGPGANKSQRVKWIKHLSGAGLDKFKKISFIDEDGWIAKLPKTIFG